VSGKTKQWLLLGLVALIWGLIMVRLFDLTSQPEETLSPIRLSAKDLAKTADEPYRFYLNYPDPFLKDLSTPAVKELAPVENRERPMPKAIPQVVFRGTVSGTRVTTGMLMLNMMPRMVKKGDSIEEFKVLEVNAGEIKLYYQPLDSVLVVSKADQSEIFKRRD